MAGRNNCRVAVVGFGYWGKNLVRNFHHLGALSTVCENDPNNLKSFKSQYPHVQSTENFDDILSDKNIDAIVISTPAEKHAEFVSKSLNANKDVFVEKPLCLSPAQGDGLVKLAKKNKRILMVGHLLWYHPAILKLQELINQGELGDLQYIYSTRLNLGKIRREENILWSFAPHDLSVILGLLNEEPNHIQAQGGSYLQKNIVDVTTSLLSFPSGVKSHIFVSWLHPYKQQRLIVVGSKNMAVFDDLEPKNKLSLYPHTINIDKGIPIVHKAKATHIPIDLGEPLKFECEHFIDCVQSRKTPRTDGEEGLRVLKVLQECQKALSDE